MDVEISYCILGKTNRGGSSHILTGKSRPDSSNGEWGLQLVFGDRLAGAESWITHVLTV